LESYIASGDGKGREGRKGRRKEERKWEEVGRGRDAKCVLFRFGIMFMSFTGRLPGLQKLCSKGLGDQTLPLVRNFAP